MGPIEGEGKTTASETVWPNIKMREDLIDLRLFLAKKAARSVDAIIGKNEDQAYLLDGNLMVHLQRGVVAFMLSYQAGYSSDGEPLKRVDTISPSGILRQESPLYGRRTPETPSRIHFKPLRTEQRPTDLYLNIGSSIELISMINGLRPLNSAPPPKKHG